MLPEKSCRSRSIRGGQTVVNDTRQVPAMNTRIFTLLLSLFLPGLALAQWSIVTHQAANSLVPTKIAQTTNGEGYSLEIYRDTGDAIRSRITLTPGLISLAGKSCPTYQIDTGKPRNRSLDDAPCIAQARWAEFILGQVADGKIESSVLLSMMNGINITFRFALSNGDYRETQFSLAGSKWTMQSIFGQNVTVTASK